MWELPQALSCQLSSNKTESLSSALEDAGAHVKLPDLQFPPEGPVLKSPDAGSGQVSFTSALGESGSLKDTGKPSLLDLTSAKQTIIVGQVPISPRKELAGMLSWLLSQARDSN